MGSDKRLNKARMKEYLCKRYPDQLAERIMKGIMPHFNNFSFNLDFNFYCEAIESLVNQTEMVIFLTLNMIFRVQKASYLGFQM